MKLGYFRSEILTQRSTRSIPVCCSRGSGMFRKPCLGASPLPAFCSSRQQTSWSRPGEAGTPRPLSTRTYWEERGNVTNEAWWRIAAENFYLDVYSLMSWYRISGEVHLLVKAVALYPQPVINPFLADSFVIQPTVKNRGKIRSVEKRVTTRETISKGALSLDHVL